MIPSLYAGVILARTGFHMLALDAPRTRGGDPMTTDEIYGLFCAADYSKLKLLQVLADVVGIDVYELINIIEKK